MEWLIHAALHNHPGMGYRGLRKLRIFKGVTLGGNDDITLQISATQPDNDNIVVVELRQAEVLHAAAEIILTTDDLNSEAPGNKPITGKPLAQSISAVYSSDTLFHGQMLQGIKSIDACSSKGISAAVQGGLPPKYWMRHPLHSAWRADPLALDSCFQLIIVWGMEQFSMVSLPTSIGEYQQFQQSFPHTGCLVCINITHYSETTIKADIELTDKSGAMVARIRDYECTMSPSLIEAFKNNQLPEPKDAS
jgi:hypothetical protein